MIDPESESDDDNIKFVDDYDKTGVRIMPDIHHKNGAIAKTLTDFASQKSYTSGFFPPKGST